MEIFRKSALDKLSSPDQLDKMIVVTSPMTWITFIGGLIIVIATLIWGFLGRIPESVETGGIMIAGDGTGVTYSEVSGIVSDVKVEPGQIILKGQVIASIDSGDITEDIQILSDRIKAVESITMDSEGDVATADNKQLLDIKAELIPLQENLDQAHRNYDVMKREADYQKEVVARAESDMNQKREAMYASIPENPGAAEQAKYSETQNDAYSMKSYEESSFTSMKNAQTAVKQAEDQEERMKDKMKDAEKDMDKAEERYKRAEKNYNEVMSNPSSTDAEKAAAEEEASSAYQVYQNEKSNYESWRSNFRNARENVSQAKDALETAEETYVNYVNKHGKSDEEYEKAKQEYIDYQNQNAKANRESNIANNEYSWATNVYSTEKNKLDNYKQSLINLETDVLSATEQVEDKKQVLQKSFDASKDGIISNLQLEMNKLTRNLKKSEIVSTQTGVIKEVVVTNGSALQAGGEVIKVTKGNATAQDALCYVPVTQGKKIVPGMEVLLYPTTTNKQEEGHMVGTVKSVEGYITSQSEIIKTLGDNTLAESFLKNGPVVEVKCSIKEDSDTVSGYYWSSKKGAKVQIADGTIFTAKIVTEKKAPITMLIPLLKEKLTIKPVEPDKKDQ